MELFSEIHSRYFYIIGEILKAAASRALAAQEIANLVSRLGFAETPLSLTPQDCYVRKADSGYIPLLKHAPEPMITGIQKRWLKAVVSDKRFSLFLSENERDEFDRLFSDIKPLYDDAHLLTVDVAGDGDDYECEEYKTIFRSSLYAIQQNRIVRITYESGRGNRLTAYFAPYKLEYSLKDDKFRLCAVRLLRGRLRRFYKLNLSRITVLEVMEREGPANLAEYIESSRMPLPVEIEISNERNGFERIFTQLSNFERVSEYDETTKKCLMKIYYYKVDELELLITLLSFGPVVRVIGPEHFKEQFIERVERQKKFMEKFFLSSQEVLE